METIDLSLYLFFTKTHTQVFRSDKTREYGTSELLNNWFKIDDYLSRN